MSEEARPSAWSLRRRLVLATTLLTSAAMVILTVLVQVVLSQAVSGQIDRVLVDRAEAVIATLSLDSSGELRASETPDEALDVGVWIYDAQGKLVEGSSAGSPGTARARLAEVDTESTTETANSRVFADPIEINGSRAGVVVVSEPLGPYETTQRYALVASLALGALVVAIVAGIAGWIVRRSLEPVATMASRAADWSEHDLSRRFDLGPPRDELTSLAAVLDDLLEQVARVIVSEQRLTAELAHELRTPLTAIRGEAELAAADIVPGSVAHSRLTRIQANVDTMSATISTLMQAARASLPEARTISAAEWVESSVDQLGLDGGQAEVQDLTGLPGIAVPENIAVRCLVPVLENAVRYAHSAVVVSGRSSHGAVSIVVTDDGPGWGSVDPEDAFTAGARDASSPGAGLGLSLARRLARAAGGDVVAERSGKGAVVVVTLPSSPARSRVRDNSEFPAAR